MAHAAGSLLLKALNLELSSWFLAPAWPGLAYYSGHLRSKLSGRSFLCLPVDLPLN